MCAREKREISYAVEDKREGGKIFLGSSLSSADRKTVANLGPPFTEFWNAFFFSFFESNDLLLGWSSAG